MRGHIRQRQKGVWEVIVEAGRDAEGKRRQISRTVHGGKRDAEALLARLLSAPRTREGGRTVGDLLEAWYAHREPHWSPSGRPKKRLHLDHYLLPTLGKLRLNKLTPEHLDSLYGQIIAKGKIATARAVHSTMHAALKLGVRWEWLHSNPAERVTPLPNERRRQSTTPTPEEVALLIENAEPDLAVMIRLAAVTGVRRGQLVALCWSDVDLDNLAISFTRGVVLGANGIEVRGSKTGWAATLSIDAGTAKALAAHQERMKERVRSAGGRWTDTCYLFSVDPYCRQPMRPDGVTIRFSCLRDRLGLKTRFHDLRHFTGTQLANASFPTAGIRDRLGHRNLTTTNRYVSAVDERDRAAAQILGELLPVPRSVAD